MKNIQFTGIRSAIFTPLNADSTVKVEAVKPLVGRTLDLGGKGFYVAGSTGEGPTLNQTERKKVVSAVIEAAKSRKTVNGETPDVIIVFMGINDVGRAIDSDRFAFSYNRTLATIKEKYPMAQVCCVNLPDRDIYLKTRTIIYNNIIKEAALAAGENFFIADLFASRLNNDFYYNNTVDGLHPDRDGMQIIAEIIKDAMIANFK